MQKVPLCVHTSTTLHSTCRCMLKVLNWQASYSHLVNAVFVDHWPCCIEHASNKAVCYGDTDESNGQVAALWYKNSILWSYVHNCNNKYKTKQKQYDKLYEHLELQCIFCSCSSNVPLYNIDHSHYRSCDRSCHRSYRSCDYFQLHIKSSVRKKIEVNKIIIAVLCVVGRRWYRRYRT